MRCLQNLELKKKLVLLAAVSGTMALLMACAGFVWHDLRLLRTAQLEDLRNKAEILAFKSVSVMATEQPNAAALLMAKLKVPASVESASLFNALGTPVASYPIMALKEDDWEFPSDHYSHRYANSGELELFHPIIDHGREIGVVYLKANTQEFDEQFRSHAFMIVTVTLCSLAVALLFASMTQSWITKPILKLADAAREITSNDDYTIRVHLTSHDELGVLYTSFNRMVEKIQKSQAELKQARDELEARVEQRTRQLQEGIVQRELIQQELVRAKEAAEDASQAKSRFLANMSHEIRTPLNGILGFTDYVLIHDRNLSESNRRDCLRMIKKSGDSLLVLINDILDLSKIEAGQMDFEQVPFSPHDVIMEVVSMLRPKAYEKNLSLEFHWNGVVPETIESDPVRFRQLLTNLIGNAVKFSESGGVEIVARLEQTSCELVVEVIDTGVGIPLETQPTLFTPFTQGDSSVTRRFGGTGLGLSICQSIVDGLGGRIWVSSEPGCGSTFSFTIETGSLTHVRLLLQPPHNFEWEPEESIVSHQISLRSKRILVAEDGQTNRKLIELVLTRAGAEVVLVENGKEAIEEARKSEFDLVLMDIQMPVLDGYSATMQMRAEGFSKPIVALTANAMHGDKERCIAAGCSEYLTKPIRQELLLAKIVSLVTGEAVVIPSEPAISITNDTGSLVSELPIEDPQFAELVSEFIVRARETMTELRAAHNANDDKQMAKLAHWMKGTGGMAGFPILTESARDLEGSVKNADPHAVMAQLTRLEMLVGQLQSPEV